MIEFRRGVGAMRVLDYIFLSTGYMLVHVIPQFVINAITPGYQAKWLDGCVADERAVAQTARQERKCRKVEKKLR